MQNTTYNLIVDRNILYLTADEKKVFDRLSERLREGWVVEEETGTAYEDATVLKIRAGMARFESQPELHAFVKSAMDSGKVDPSTITTLHPSVLPELFFTIGAHGVTLLMATMLGQMQTDEDILALAGLSSIRHDILATNASISLV
jgi:hypothetical protein